MDFLNAYTYGFCEKRGFTQGKSWKRSMEEMVRSTGCNAIILPVCGFQDHIWSTKIDSDTPDVMSEADVKAVCDHARELGLKIILKAMVNCRDGTWRAYIRFFDHPVPTEPSWEEWFEAWDRHVLLTAGMAEENKADLLCVGCETVGTDHRDGEWRELIRQVRKVYHGPVTYNCDKYQEEHVSWWDAVDVISSSGYYPIADLDENFRRIQSVAGKYGKPFMFMECGCPSRTGSENRPNDWRFGKGTDPEAQRRWYEAFTDAIAGYPFIRGTGWWDWPATRLYPEFAGEDNSGYCTWGKPANQVIAEFSKRLQSSGASATEQNPDGGNAGTIMPATGDDRDAVLALYRSQKGREFCFWDKDYPGDAQIDYDLKRNSLYVMKNVGGQIIAAISVDLDENVEKLTCWSPELQPSKEISRLCVAPAYQNRGLAREMVLYAMNVLRNDGCRSIHFLVNRDNVKAIRAYAKIGFEVVGECNLYDQRFLCYEKALESSGNSGRDRSGLQGSDAD